jgi:diadenosine tetraphosphate (Ap4A) HIT family hydrolase
VCERNEQMERGNDPFAIARLETGYLKLFPVQYFRGYSLFTAKTCVAELHDLDRAVRDRFLSEMAESAHALARACDPRKMNYELLGNGCPHLHWHLAPRYATDRHPNGPVWEDLNFLRNLWTEQSHPTDSERDALRRAILAELRGAGVTIERDFVSD